MQRMTPKKKSIEAMNPHAETDVRIFTYIFGGDR